MRVCLSPLFASSSSSLHSFSPPPSLLPSNSPLFVWTDGRCVLLLGAKMKEKEKKEKGVAGKDLEINPYATEPSSSSGGKKEKTMKDAERGESGKGEIEEIAQKVRLIYARRLLVYGKSRVGWLLRKEGRSVVTHFLRETQATIHPRRPSFLPSSDAFSLFFARTPERNSPKLSLKSPMLTKNLFQKNKCFLLWEMLLPVFLANSSLGLPLIYATAAKEEEEKRECTLLPPPPPFPLFPRQRLRIDPFSLYIGV